MKKILVMAALVIFGAATLSSAQGLVIDDFEGPVSGGPSGTVDFGAGNGSSVNVTASTDIKYSGNQSIKVDFDAVQDGYMWIARGFALDAGNAAWLMKPEEINWSEYNAIAFYVYGSGSKAQVALDLKDNGNEMWRFYFEDSFKGWKEIICSFDQFFARDDWQPDSADKNGNLDFPLKSFQFEPKPVAKGVLYFDSVELVKK